MDLKVGAAWPESAKSQLFACKEWLLVRQNGWLSLLNTVSGVYSLLSSKPIFPDIRFLGAQVQDRVLAYLTSPFELVSAT